ncbi:MAG: GTP cyclohydrolase II [Pseudomonadales bacterium]|nr:GTP cyclohydrolase II [Pseudomonadales bacterium]
MFTYIDSKIRKRLIAEGKLRRIDANGKLLLADSVPEPGQLSVNILGPIPLPLATSACEMQTQWYACVRNTELNKVEELASELRASDGQHLFASLASSMAVNSILLIGDPDTWKNPLVRVHSSCLTGDVFGSQRCECGPQLDRALERISEDSQGGMLIYMSGHEGRGIGLWAKAVTYLLQDAGEDTYQANQSLGLPEDCRDFSEAAALLHFFIGEKKFRLMTNNPKKISDLKAHGLNNIEPVKHLIGVSQWNKKYLSAKQSKGHRLDDADLKLGTED